MKSHNNWFASEDEKKPNWSHCNFFTYIRTTENTNYNQLKDKVIARDFEDTFGLPLITGYQHPQTQALLTILPITLAWHNHQQLLHGYDRPSIGCEIVANSLAVINANGEALSEGENGELAVKMGDVWQGIEQGGYFVSNEGNKFFYLV